MGRILKHIDRPWMIAPILFLGALFFYLSFPLLVRGIHSFLATIIYGSAILLALPQAFWWAVATIFLSLWGLGPHNTARKGMAPEKKDEQS